jgi:hypothetical protein
MFVARKFVISDLWIVDCRCWNLNMRGYNKTSFKLLQQLNYYQKTRINKALQFKLDAI